MVSNLPLLKRPSIKHNIWLRIYIDRYQDLFTYAMKLLDNDEDLADEMVRELSFTSLAHESRLQEEMQKLPEYYADIVRLHFFKKMKPKEITKHVPLTIYQIESRIHKAVRLLREAMNPDCYRNMFEASRRRTCRLEATKIT